MKNVIITGGSSGIGRETAKLMLSKGYKVSLISRSQKRLGQLDFADHENVFLFEADVRSYDSLQHAINSAAMKMGSLDVMINNAGLGYFDPLEEGKIEEWHEMIDTNVKGVLNGIHAALPFLLKTKGHIINIGSVASHHVFPSSGIYCASKWALLAISESVRVDLKEKVGITTISPGQVDTNFVNVMSNEEIKANLKDVFANGLSPVTIAENILFAVEMKGKSVINEILIRPDLTL